MSAPEQLEDVFYVRDLSQAMVLLKPLRLELLRHLDEPRSCPELGQLVGETAQKVYYHVKALESARLVTRVAERRVGGIVEGLYLARARNYWLAPEVVGRVGGERQAREQVTLGYLLNLAEQLQEDVAGLAAQRTQETPSVAIAADIALLDGEARAAFLAEVESAVTRIAGRFGIGDGSDNNFRLVVACYPKPTPPRSSRTAGRATSQRRRAR